MNRIKEVRPPFATTPSNKNVFRTNPVAKGCLKVADTSVKQETKSELEGDGNSRGSAKGKLSASSRDLRAAYTRREKQFT